MTRPSSRSPAAARRAGTAGAKHEQRRASRRAEGIPPELAGLPVSALALRPGAAAALAQAGYLVFGDVLDAGKRRVRALAGVDDADLRAIQAFVGALASAPADRISALSRPGGPSPWTTLPAAVVVAVASAPTLKAEVRGLVAGLSRRDADAFLRRLGVAPGPVPTLSSLGAEFGVTRERIRQVCALHAKLLASSGLRLPTACAVAELVREAGGMAGAARLVELCRASGLSATAADMRVLPALVELGLMPEIAWRDDIMQWVAPGSEANAAVYAVRFNARLRVARTDLRRYGAVPKYWEGIDDDIAPDDIVTALARDGARLREASRWLVALPAGDNAFVRVARKVLSVAEALTAAELAQAAARKLRVSLPASVVRLILANHEDFEVSGKTVRLAVDVRAAETLSAAEATGMRLVRECGGAVSGAEFSKRMLAAGYSLARARQILAGPLIRKSLGLYRIRGRRASPSARGQREAS